MSLFEKKEGEREQVGPINIFGPVSVWGLCSVDRKVGGGIG